MKIENKSLTLNPFRIDIDKAELICLRSGQALSLSQKQLYCFNMLSKGKTIESLTKEIVGQGQPFSFGELYQLIEGLLKIGILTDSDVKCYFDSIQSDIDQVTSAAGVPGKQRIGKWTPQNLLQIPFFRNLTQVTANAFIQFTDLFEAPERTKIIGNKETTREMYALLDGEASIYRVDEKGKRQLITTVPPGSIFGEGAFFFNKERTADVITNTRSILARITFDEKTFDPLFKSTDAQSLQQRFWILHGLLSSELFNQVPTETMDYLALIGTSRTVKLNEIICAEDEAGDSFFIVIQGKMNVIHGHKVIKTLKPGDIFGEIALMVSQGTRIATVQSSTVGLLLEITKADFYKALSQNLILAKEIEEIALLRYKKIAD